MPVEGRGTVQVQLAFGGAYYGIVDAADLGLRVVPAAIEALTACRRGHHRRASARTTRRRIPRTPTSASSTAPSSSTTSPATAPDGRATDATMRNVTVFADAEVDRSPCGSGTSALLAWLHAAGRLEHGPGHPQREHHGRGVRGPRRIGHDPRHRERGRHQRGGQRAT